MLVGKNDALKLQRANKNLYCYSCQGTIKVFTSNYSKSAFTSNNHPTHGLMFTFSNTANEYMKYHIFELQRKI